MIQELLNTWFLRLNNLLERFLGGRYWAFKWSLLCFFAIAFLSFPSLQHVVHPEENSIWEAVQKQIDEPFAQHYADQPDSHHAKRTFRLCMPILCKALHIHGSIPMYILQLVVSFLFFILTAKLAFQITKNKTSSALLALALAFTYVGQSGIVDVFGKFDTIALTCLLAALYFTNPLLIFLFCSLAAWTDERGLIAGSMVFVWWKLQEQLGARMTLKSLFTPGIRSLSVILAMGGYLGLRYFLQQSYGMETATGKIGLEVFMGQFNMIFFGLWTGFEGLWIAVFLGIISMVLKKDYLLIFLIAISSLASITVAFLVIDITRSLIYLFPLLFVVLHQLSKTEEEKYIRKMAWFCLALCLMVPTYFAEGGFRIEGTNPVFFKILDWIRG